jgi:putative membrane protein insertion efficiency factor
MPRLNPSPGPSGQGSVAAWAHVSDREVGSTVLATAPTSACGWRQAGRRISLWPRRILQWPVRAYRLLLSPCLGSACRFWPTCSAYALEALDRHGAVAGCGLTLWRIARCQPWCAGGHDAVPDHVPSLFTGLLLARRPLPPSGKKSP